MNVVGLRSPDGSPRRDAGARRAVKADRSALQHQLASQQAAAEALRQARDLLAQVPGAEPSARQSIESDEQQLRAALALIRNGRWRNAVLFTAGSASPLRMVCERFEAFGWTASIPWALYTVDSPATDDTLQEACHLSANTEGNRSSRRMICASASCDGLSAASWMCAQRECMLRRFDARGKLVKETARWLQAERKRGQWEAEGQFARERREMDALIGEQCGDLALVKEGDGVRRELRVKTDVVVLAAQTKRAKRNTERSNELAGRVAEARANRLLEQYDDRTADHSSLFTLQIEEEHLRGQGAAGRSAWWHHRFLFNELKEPPNPAVRNGGASSTLGTEDEPGSAGWTAEAKGRMTEMGQFQSIASQEADFFERLVFVVNAMATWLHRVERWVYQDRVLDMRAIWTVMIDERHGLQQKALATAECLGRAGLGSAFGSFETPSRARIVALTLGDEGLLRLGLEEQENRIRSSLRRVQALENATVTRLLGKHFIERVALDGKSQALFLCDVDEVSVRIIHGLMQEAARLTAACEMWWDHRRVDRLGLEIAEASFREEIEQELASVRRTEHAEGAGRVAVAAEHHAILADLKTAEAHRRQYILVSALSDLQDFERITDEHQAFHGLLLADESHSRTRTELSRWLGLRQIDRKRVEVSEAYHRGPIEEHEARGAVELAECAGFAGEVLRPFAAGRRGIERAALAEVEACVRDQLAGEGVTRVFGVACAEAWERAVAGGRFAVGKRGIERRAIAEAETVVRFQLESVFAPLWFAVHLREAEAHRLIMLRETLSRHRCQRNALESIETIDRHASFGFWVQRRHIETFGEAHARGVMHAECAGAWKRIERAALGDVEAAVRWQGEADEAKLRHAATEAHERALILNGYWTGKHAIQRLLLERSEATERLVAVQEDEARSRVACAEELAAGAHGVAMRLRLAGIERAALTDVETFVRWQGQVEAASWFEGAALERRAYCLFAAQQSEELRALHRRALCDVEGFIRDQAGAELARGYEGLRELAARLSLLHGFKSGCLRILTRELCRCEAAARLELRAELGAGRVAAEERVARLAVGAWRSHGVDLHRRRLLNGWEAAARVVVGLDEVRGALALREAAARTVWLLEVSGSLQSMRRKNHARHEERVRL
eukprot:gene21076-32474_t